MARPRLDLQSVEDVAQFLGITTAAIEYIRAHPDEAGKLLGYEAGTCPNVKFGSCSVTGCPGNRNQPG